MRRLAAYRLAVALVAACLFSTAALAQRDLSGTWRALYHEDFPERIPGPNLVEYQGLPINEAARQRGLSWDASILSVPEHQCRPHPADYGSRHSHFRIWTEFDADTQELIAYRFRREWQAAERTIYMDGRPHPPANAPHTWQGFSTGVWEGDKLKVTTTHLKNGYVRRNGLPRSDRATMVEYYYRVGRDHLTVVRMIEDPVYLTEPLVQSSDYRLDLELRIDAYPCDIVEEVVGMAPGYVPHFLPGRHPSLTEFADEHGLPMEAALGGAETMYPSFIEETPRPGARPARGAAAVAAARESTSARRARVPGTEAQAPALEVLHVRGNIHVISGPGGNTTVQIGRDGVLVVDPQPADAGAALLAAIRTLSDRPIRYVINTHVHEDHIGGNEILMAAGRTIAGGNVARELGDAAQGAKGIAHENVLLWLASLASPPPYRAWPTDFYVERPKELHFNGEAIRILHQPAAHTDGDSIVYFRLSDVVSTGNVYLTTGYPVIDLERGGGIQGIVDALNRIIEIAIPRDRQEGGTMIVPGHGRISDEADVVEYRDMLTIIRDRVLDMVAAGFTLEEVQAARPTLDYDPHYGADTGSWTTQAFVAAVYRSLVDRVPQARPLTSRDQP
jgi:cyclase